LRIFVANLFCVEISCYTLAGCECLENFKNDWRYGQKDRIVFIKSQS
jgi:hypothetical protein